MIELRSEDLSLRYDKKQVVHELSMSIPTNQITCLIGPNGSGKSTLLKGFARLLRPSQGVVYLDGHAIHNQNTKKVARQLSILAQINDAPDGLSVRELLALGRYPHRSFLGVPNSNDNSAINKALEIVGISHLTDRLLGELSGGQRQLAWIAMTLAQETSIILLDEPTTFLDLAHQLEVLMVLENLQRNHDRTIVLVLHDINLAARFSDHLVAMKEGRIVCHGTPREVITTEMLSDVFGIEAVVRVDESTQCPFCIPIRPI